MGIIQVILQFQSADHQAFNHLGDFKDERVRESQARRGSHSGPALKGEGRTQHSARGRPFPKEPESEASDRELNFDGGSTARPCEPHRSSRWSALRLPMAAEPRSRPSTQHGAHGARGAAPP
eukprot:g12999.t1